MTSVSLGADELLALSDSLSTSGLNDYENEFLEIFEKIGKEERGLVTKLIGRFEVCRLENYLRLAENLIQSIVERVDAAPRVICLPLSDPTEVDSPKSAAAVTWLLKRDIERVRLSSGQMIELYSSISVVKSFAESLSATFVLLDDFVGSGNTAVKAVDRLVRKGVPVSQIVVAAYVGMASGRKAILDSGAEPVFLKVLPKGITDSTDISDKDSALKIMERLEISNGVSKKFRFGYEASEALALMCFCPNNTFPFFWWDGSLWQGPFRR